MKKLLIVPQPDRFLIAFLALGMAGWWGPALQAAERMALVIGNGAYRATSALPNPPEDARLVGGALRSAGFEVTEKTNVSLDKMRAVLEKFQEEARGARASAVALYYAGHGMEVNGANYLIPVDAEVKEEYQITSRTLPLAEVMGALDNTQAALKIVVLDCCRDNPLGRSFRRSSGVGGLAALSDTPEGTIIAYATSPNRTALDGTGKNSPFASAFSTALTQPGLTAEEVFKFTIGSVKKQTNKEQQPWLSLNYEGRFFFLPVDGKEKVKLRTPHEDLPPSAPLPSLGTGFKSSSGMLLSWVAPLRAWVGTTEVTQDQYSSVMGGNPSAIQGGTLPVNNVTWQEAQNFCRLLTSQDRVAFGSGFQFVYQLPTDADYSVYVEGSTLSDAITSVGSQRSRPASVGSLNANTYGLYDVRGNVWEWLADRFERSMNRAETNAKLINGLASQGRVLRGGSYSTSESSKLDIGTRASDSENQRDKTCGFRVILKVKN